MKTKHPTVTLYLRVSPEVHEAVQEAADERGLSITEYCNQILINTHDLKEHDIGGYGSTTSDADHSAV